MSDTEADTMPDFRSLLLSDAVLGALGDVGYETPSAIQAQTIPHMLAGRDVLAQAQTGTGKTAAFALPLLSNIDLNARDPQVLVLTPTRELAIQVSEAFQRYASRLQGFHVLPVYGGQDYTIQLKQLKRAVHIVVGTPGRVMDHMRRGTLKLDTLRCLVLDEADEMLRMGFIDDVEWVLEQSPPGRQIALFSATLPEPIRRIAKKHLKSPAEVTIKVRTTTAESIHQRYWLVSGLHKLDALTRILEAESFDGMIVFVRTKTMTAELTEKLAARGYSVAALSGDIQQKQRERTIERLKSGHLDIIVATDVAARGLDVDRISHVINYDIPHDTESYVHRIGRTGRFGRKGEAILFVAPREKHMLGIIERATRQKIELMELPSTELLNSKRIDQFTQRITDTLASEQLDFYYQLMEKYQHEHNKPALEIAAALARLVQGDTPLLLKVPAKTQDHEKSFDRPRHSHDKRERPQHPSRDKRDHRDRKPASQPARSDNAAPASRNDQRHAHDKRERPQHPSRDKREDRDRKPATLHTRPDNAAPADRNDRRPQQRSAQPEARPARFERKDRPGKPERTDGGYKKNIHTDDPRAQQREPARPPGDAKPRPGMERFRLDIGHRHGIKPGSIVGVITAEAGLTTRNIDQISIHENYSTVDLPEGMPREIYRDLKNAKIAGQRLNISRLEPAWKNPGQFEKRPDKPAHMDKKPGIHRGKKQRSK